MSIPILCLFISALLIYVAKLPVGYAMGKAGGYDNRHPREQQSRLEGWGKRAVGAHMNSFEGFSLFAASILSAKVMGVQSPLFDIFSIVYVCSRPVYIALYLANYSSLRSLTWFVGMIAIVGNFILALRAG